MVVLERNLVEIFERPDLDRLDLPQPEVLEDRGLCLLVDPPVVADLLRDADFATIERGDRFLDVHQATSRKISAARSHSSNVGTRAKRT